MILRLGALRGRGASQPDHAGRAPGLAFSSVQWAGGRPIPGPSAQTPAPKQTRDPQTQHPTPRSPFPRAPPRSTKPHPVPDPGPSSLRPRDTPAGPTRSETGRTASPLCMSGNVISREHCGTGCSRIFVGDGSELRIQTGWYSRRQSISPQKKSPFLNIPKSQGQSGVGGGGAQKSHYSDGDERVREGQRGART